MLGQELDADAAEAVPYDTALSTLSSAATTITCETDSDEEATQEYLVMNHYLSVTGPPAIPECDYDVMLTYEPAASGTDELLEIEVPHHFAKFFITEIQPDKDEVLVFQVNPKSGAQRVIVERELNVLTSEESRKHRQLIKTAMRKELKGWHDLNTMRPQRRNVATNLVDGKWVNKWKIVDGVKTVKSRLTLRGFKDIQGAMLQTFAGTATRWSQRLVCSIAAIKGWPLFTADVGQAFLRGLTFEELAKLTGEPIRKVSLEVDKETIEIIRELPGYSNFDYSWVLELLKPAYGLKDAPRLWGMKLDMVIMKRTGAIALRIDRRVYVWFQNGNFMLIMSTHVDDFKGAGLKDWAEWVLKELSEEFGVIKISWNNFEHVGVMHERLEDGTIIQHQDHYVKQLKPIDVATLAGQDEDAAVVTWMVNQFMTLVGALAWLTLTRPDICVFIAALQRVTADPRVRHIRKANAVLRWIRRKPCRLTYKPMKGPFRVMAIGDSAFKRMGDKGLAVKGGIVGLSEIHDDHPGGMLHVIEYYSRRHKRVMRSTFGAEGNSMVDIIETAKGLALAMEELLSGPQTGQQMYNIELEGRFTIGIESVTDARSLYEAVKAGEAKVPAEDSLILCILLLREAVQTGRVRRIWWVDTDDMAADALTKGIVSRQAILDLVHNSCWILKKPAMSFSTLGKAVSTAPQVDDEDAGTALDA
jgi:hypothetical protein